MDGQGGLGRRIPSDFDHVTKYPLRTVMPEAVASVETTLHLPPFRAKYDQGQEGACVGFGWSWTQSIRNHPFYDARWLYHNAQLVDEYSDTPPADGTSVRAGGDILRDRGHCRLLRGKTQPVDPAAGIVANRWATTVDEVRTAISEGQPVTLGINWYANFDHPITEPGNPSVHWIGKGDLGHVRGGHCICCYGASDHRDAVKLVNSWGLGYPLVWLPYTVLQRLIDESGEAAITTDR